MTRAKPPEMGDESELVTVTCNTYCLNDVSVTSPFCDCAPAAKPPQTDDDSILSLIIGLLTALGVIGGSALR